jgi:hypothetical protein
MIHSPPFRVYFSFVRNTIPRLTWLPRLSDHGLERAFAAVEGDTFLVQFSHDGGGKVVGHFLQQGLDALDVASG